MGEKLTTEQAAKELGYHVDHVRRLLRAGIIQAEKFNRVWMIDRQEVERIRKLQGPDGRLPYGLEPEQ